jgi:hypothetical protein
VTWSVSYQSKGDILHTGDVTITIHIDGSFSFAGKLFNVGFTLDADLATRCGLFQSTITVTKIRRRWWCLCQYCGSPGTNFADPMCRWVGIPPDLICKGQQVRNWIQCLGKPFDISNVFYPFSDQSKECRDGG